MLITRKDQNRIKYLLTTDWSNWSLRDEINLTVSQLNVRVLHLNSARCFTTKFESALIISTYETLTVHICNNMHVGRELLPLNLRNRHLELTELC